MLKKYHNYIKDNYQYIYKIECQINKKYLFDISGKNNLIDAINNELKWTDTIKILSVNEPNNNIYILSADIDPKIKNDTDSNDITESIYNEFYWLTESGIFIKNVTK